MASFAKNGTNCGEKLKLMEITLRQGEQEYIQRLDDIKLLKLEVRRLRRENEILSKGLQNFTALQLEVIRLEREARIERIKVKALQEALETPQNVHHWRRPTLGTQTAKEEGEAELRERLNILHKELLRKTQKLTECEKISKLAAMSSRSTTSESDLKEELRMLRTSVNRQSNKIRFLSTELKVKDSQLFELKLDNDRLSSELRQMKCKNNIESRRSSVREKSGQSTPPSSQRSKILGGGFKLT